MGFLSSLFGGGKKKGGGGSPGAGRTLKRANIAKRFELSGHLYVLYGTVSIDVYSRGDSDEENLAKEKAIAKVLIPKI